MKQIKDIMATPDDESTDATSKSLVKEFLEKLRHIETEKALLADDRKQLFEEYKDKINLKALKAAIRIIRIRARLGSDEMECDNYIESIENPV